MFAAPLTKNAWLQTVYFTRLNSKQPIWMELKRNILEQQQHGISGKKVKAVREKWKERHLGKFVVNSSKPAQKVFAALLY